LNRPELRALERFTKLHTLSLAGSKLTQASVSSIVKLKSLTELDLSNCILDNDAMSLLAAECPRSLMRLRLDGATLPGKSFLDLARTHTQLRFSFDNAIVDPRATDFLVENDRIIHEQTLGLPLWFTANNPWLVGEVEDSQETFGEIDPDRYAVTNVHDLVE
jgi:hypothetical protein